MLILIGLILGILAGARFTWVDSRPVTYLGDHADKSKRDWKEFWAVLWRVSGIGAIVGLGLGLLFSLMVYTATTDDVPRRFDIVSLGDGAGVEGRAFLGSGSVDTEAVFFYYGHRSSGGLGLFHVDADITSIYEDQTTDGYMIQYCEDSESGAKWLNLPLIDIMSEPSEEDRYDCSYPSRVEFHIPANSIDRAFNLDAQ